MRYRHLRWQARGLFLCGLMLTLFTAALSAATATDAVWSGQSFQRLAARDLPAAEEVWMQSATQQLWQQLSTAAIEDSLDAAAVFSHMLWFPAQGPRDTWLVGLFNPWIGGLLVLQFDDTVTSIEAFYLVTTDVPTIAGDSSAAFAASIARRLAAGVDAFEDLVTAWPRRGGLEPNPVAWEILGVRLETYRDEMRRLLSPDGFSVWQPARENYVSALEALAASDLPSGYAAAQDLPLAWRQTVVPVWASEQSDALNVLVSADADPYTLLWLSLKTQAGNPAIHNLAVIDLFGLLAGTGGGQ